MASTKKCLVFETLGRVDNMDIMESKDDGAVRLHGVFGVCGVKNGNNRIYSKENYGRMVENLQKVIANEGCLGELEHPNTMNINLDNVSHKIESIEMDESGTITGTIRLLDTVKGKNAKAIVEAGCPLFISSRGAGSIDEAGNVTLSTIKTYDLVGTPGFSQAKLTLKENQKFESLNESLSIIYEEEDDLLGKDDDKKDGDEGGDDNKSSDDKDKKEDEKPTDEPTEEPKDDNNKDNNDKVTMEDIKNALDKLSEKVTSLEAELHVAQESLNNVKPINYEAIEKWVTEEFAPGFTEDIKEAVLDDVDEKITESQEAIATGVQRWVAEEYTPNVEKFINEEFSENVENWITNEYSPIVQQWVTEHYDETVKNYINEEFAGNIEKWINEEYSATLQNWINEEYTSSVKDYINEEYSATLQNWINEEFVPAQKEAILNEAYQNVNEFLESKKDDRLSQIDKMLESIDAMGGTAAVDALVKEQNETNKFKGVYVVENMPSQYAPIWNGLSEAKQTEIIRSSRLYDFTKAGVLESFWANADLTDKPINENQQPNGGAQPTQISFIDSVAMRMKSLRSGF